MNESDNDGPPVEEGGVTQVNLMKCYCHPYTCIL